MSRGNVYFFPWVEINLFYVSLDVIWPSLWSSLEIIICIILYTVCRNLCYIMYPVLCIITRRAKAYTILCFIMMNVVHAFALLSDKLKLEAIWRWFSRCLMPYLLCWKKYGFGQVTEEWSFLFWKAVQYSVQGLGTVLIRNQVWAVSSA